MVCHTHAFTVKMSSSQWKLIGYERSSPARLRCRCRWLGSTAPAPGALILAGPSASTQNPAHANKFISYFGACSGSKSHYRVPAQHADSGRSVSFDTKSCTHAHRGIGQAPLAHVGLQNDCNGACRYAGLAATSAEHACAERHLLCLATNKTDTCDGLQRTNLTCMDSCVTRRPRVNSFSFSYGSGTPYRRITVWIGSASTCHKWRTSSQEAD